MAALGKRRFAERTLAGCACALLASACSSEPSARPDGGPVDATARDAGSPRESGADSGADAPASAPTLVQLDVKGGPAADGSAGPTLTPPFSPRVHDYTVRCHSGKNSLTVSMTASPGAEASLTRPTRSPPAASQTLTIGVDENQAIVAVASNAAGTTAYWVRCLPEDFPAFEWVTHPRAGAPPPGYYLVGDLKVNVGSAYAVVFDENGVPVWYHQEAAAKGVIHVDSPLQGEISFKPWSFAQAPYELRRLVPPETTYITVKDLDEHELRVLPDGHFLVIANPLVAGVDLSGLVITEPDGGRTPLGKDQYILDCDVVEVDAKGAVVWRWTATDHLDPQRDCTWPQPAVTPQMAPDGGLIVETFHCNAIDVDPETRDLLVSSRAMDSIFYIERSTGRILWKMGGTPYTKDGATYVPANPPFYRQHDARLQPGWSSRCGGGQVTLFDDETQKSMPSRAAVYDVAIAPGDGGAAADCGPTKTVSRATRAWEYAGQVESSSMGSFRISDDGSRVIGWGLGGTPGLVFTEVDVAGHDLLDFYFPGAAGSYRAIKVPPSQLDISALRETAGE